MGLNVEHILLQEIVMGIKTFWNFRVSSSSTCSNKMPEAFKHPVPRTAIIPFLTAEQFMGT